MFRSLSVIALLACLAGCGADEPAAAPVPLITPSAAASADLAGLRACGLLKQAVGNATLMDPGVVEAIGLAGAPADAPVSGAASRLTSAYTAALASRGTDAEPDAVAAVSAAGAEMTRTCTAAGLETVG